MSDWQPIGTAPARTVVWIYAEGKVDLAYLSGHKDWPGWFWYAPDSHIFPVKPDVWCPLLIPSKPVEENSK